MITAPLHQSLVTAITVMGVPRKIFWVNLIIGLNLVMLGAWWLIIPSLIIHLAAAKIAKDDPEFFNLLTVYYLNSKDYLVG